MSDTKINLTNDRKEIILANLDNLKKELPSINNMALRSDLKELFKNNVSSFDDVALINVMKSSSVHAGFQTVIGNAAAVDKLYNSVGIVPEAVDPAMSPANGAGVDAAVSALTQGDLSGAMAAVSKGGKLDPLMVATVVAGASKLFGAKGMDVAKYSALASLGAVAINFFGGEKSGDLMKSLSEGFGKGSESFVGGISNLLGGATDGAGGILGQLGETLGSLGDDDSIGGLFKKTLGLVKDQPLLAAALGYGLHKMFKNGLSFGGIFSNLPSLAIAVAVAWAAQSVLGLGEGSRNQGIIVDAPEIPTDIAKTNSEAVQVGV